jgi:tetratricopeptide (TPR) repeat protein
MFSSSVAAQVDEICSEFGLIPSLAGPRLQAPFLYGKVSVKARTAQAKFPKISIVNSERGQSPIRLTISKSGNYCFKKTSDGGTLIVDVDGREVDRRNISSFGQAQQREDFDVMVASNEKLAAPPAIPPRLFYPPNENTIELHRKALEAEAKRDAKAAIGYLTEIVAIDPADFIAWALLGSQHLEQKSFADADIAFRRSLEIKPEYTPAWINVGKMRVEQNQLDAAVGIFQHAAELDPTAARIYQLLGETYLKAKKGSLGVEALNKAIELDPIGMAECHLLIARLYDLAGAKKEASKEYKQFLDKVSHHPDKKKFEKYVKDNPVN